MFLANRYVNASVPFCVTSTAGLNFANACLNVHCPVDPTPRRTALDLPSNALCLKNAVETQFTCMPWNYPCISFWRSYHKNQQKVPRPLFDRHPVVQDFVTQISYGKSEPRVKDERAARVVEIAGRLSAADITLIFQKCVRNKYLNRWLFDQLGKRVVCGPKWSQNFRSKELEVAVGSLGALCRLDHSRVALCPSFGKMMNELVCECLFRASRDADCFDARGVANIIQGLGWAFAFKKQRWERLEDNVGKLVTALLRNLDKTGRVEGCSPLGLVNIVHGCANIGLPNMQELDKLSMGIPQAVHLLYESELSRLVSALGKLRRAHFKVLEALGEELVKPGRLEKFKEQHLAIIVHGLGKLGFRDARVLSTLGEEITKPKRLRNFTVQGLSNIVYGFGQSGYMDESILYALGKEFVRPPNLSQANEQCFSNIIYAFGKLGYKNDELLDAMGVEIQKPAQLKEFHNQALPNIVYAFGQLGYKNEEVLKHFSAEIEKGVRLQNFTEQALCNLVYGFGKLGYKSTPVVDKLCTQISKKPRLAAFNEQELSLIVYSMGKLKHFNEIALSGLSDEIAKPERLEKFEDKHLSNIVYGLGKLGYRNGRVLSALAAEIGKPSRLTHMNEQALSNILVGFGKVGYKNGTVLMDIIEEARKPQRMSQFSDIAWGNIVHAVKSLGVHADGMFGDSERYKDTSSKAQIQSVAG